MDGARIYRVLLTERKDYIFRMNVTKTVMQFTVYWRTISPIKPVFQRTQLQSGIRLGEYIRVCICPGAVCDLMRLLETRGVVHPPLSGREKRGVKEKGRRRLRFLQARNAAESGAPLSSFLQDKFPRPRERTNVSRWQSPSIN